MITLKIKNFFKGNTPKFIQIIGDIGLLAAFISANIFMFKKELIDIGLTSLDHNLIFDKINTICLVIGSIVKFATKFFGTNSLMQREEETDQK